MGNQLLSGIYSMDMGCVVHVFHGLKSFKTLWKLSFKIKSPQFDVDSC